MRSLSLAALSLSLLVISCENLVTLETAEGTSIDGSSTLSGPPNLVSGEEWIQIPANAGGMGLSTFYVMKYEAKAILNDESAISSTGTDATTATHKPVSVATNQPWRNINANDAAAECESLGSGYHLISNSEWMAIARDIEDQGSNWLTGTVGGTCLFAGNATDDLYGTPRPCGYNTGDYESGTSRDSKSQLSLSNSEVIFDLSGNVDEWVDWDPDTAGYQVSGATSCYNPWENIQLNSVSCGFLLDIDFNTQNGSYGNNEHVGFLSGGNGTDGAITRGGSVNNQGAGVFAINFGRSLSSELASVGFRCVYRP